MLQVIFAIINIIFSNCANAEYYPYPVILVYGRMNNSSDWNGIIGRLNSKVPNLKIVAYDVNQSENECVNQWGQEIGDREYCFLHPEKCKMGKTWMEKAHDDLGSFSKAVLVGFSTGGIAVRE